MLAKKDLVIILLVLFLAISIYDSLAANHIFLLKDNTTNFTVIVEGSSTYRLSAYFNVSSTNNGNATSPINVTFYMPWGMRPQAVSRCNATQGFRRINVTTTACSIHIANRINSAPRFKNNTLINLTIIENISAFPYGLSRAEKFWVVVASNGTGTVSNTTAAARRFGKPFKINPRPYTNRTSKSYDSIFRFTFWNQSRPSYEVWVPIFGFNTTSGNPTIANKSYAAIIYADKSFLDNPTLFELWSFRLNFTIYFNGAGNATYGIYINDINTTGQIFSPLALSTMSVPTLDKTNVTQTFAYSSPTGNFDVWFNKTRYTNTSLSSKFKINVSFNTAFGNSSLPTPERFRLLTVAAPGRYGGNVNLSVLFTLITASSDTASPLYIENQHVGGFNPAAGDSAPEAGKNKTMNFRIKAKNLMQNFTLRQLKIRFLVPINVSIQNGSKPKSKLVYSHNVTWQDTAGVWNYTLGRSIMTRNVDCSSIIDHMPGSPSNGRNITICFYNYLINLTSSKFNNWDPGNVGATNITANMTAIFSFPVMNRTDNTPDTPESVNTYNATISVSQAGRLSLTNEVPGLDSSDTNVVIRLDGVQLSGNYTIGSLVLNSVGQGTHTISASYRSAAAVAGTSGIGAGGSSGGARVINEYVMPFRVRDSFRFTIKGIRHDLRLDELDTKAKIAKFTLASNPMQFTMVEKESRLFDTDENGLNDLNITVDSIEFQRAVTIIKEITEVQLQPLLASPPVVEAVPETTGETVKEPSVYVEQELPEERGANYKMLWIGVGSVILAAIIIAVIMEKKGKDKKTKFKKNQP